MLTTNDILECDGVPLARLQNASLRVDLAPSVGGRVVSLFCKRSGSEILWRNSKQQLCKQPYGCEYDPVFFGGIDEILPNDIPEAMGGVMLLDHGELWTSNLSATTSATGIELKAHLPLSGLRYERSVALRGDEPVLLINYRIRNERTQPARFMFKLHAALPANPGDRIVCPARRGQVADPAWSRWKTTAPFAWPHVGDGRADIVPTLAANASGECDFLYLDDLQAGSIGWLSPTSGLAFRYDFDVKVFPFCWLFASYGGFYGHHTVVLEPCTTKPISLVEASASGSCTVLQPGETLQTQVTIRAGRIADVFGAEL